MNKILSVLLILIMSTSVYSQDKLNKEDISNYFKIYDSLPFVGVDTINVGIVVDEKLKDILRHEDVLLIVKSRLITTEIVVKEYYDNFEKLLFKSPKLIFVLQANELSEGELIVISSLALRNWVQLDNVVKNLDSFDKDLKRAIEFSKGFETSVWDVTMVNYSNASSNSAIFKESIREMLDVFIVKWYEANPNKR